MVEFYVKVFGFVIRESDNSHTALVSNEFELVLLQASEEYTDSVEIQKPQKARELTAIKPVFFVDRNMSEYRKKVVSNGGFFNLNKNGWGFNDHTVCDGWDIEGNIFQVRSEITI